MGKKLRLARRLLVPRGFWSSVRGNLKWGLGVFMFVLIIVLITIPPVIWLNIDWITHRPIIQTLFEFSVPIIFSIIVGSVFRTFYLLWQRS